MKKLIVSCFLIFLLLLPKNTKKEIDYDIYQPNRKEGILGKIEIPSLNISNEIILGITEEHLNMQYVAMHTNQSSLDVTAGNFILAGHRREHVFYSLNKTSIGAEIIITSLKKQYFYEVISIDIIQKDDFHYFKEVSNQRILTILTCTMDNKKRIIVIAKEK